jgi:hypothetical protein
MFHLYVYPALGKSTEIGNRIVAARTERGEIIMNSGFFLS